MRTGTRVTKDGNVRNRAGNDPGLNDTITQLIQRGRDREAAELGSERLAPTRTGVAMDPLSQLDEIVPMLNELVSSLDDDQLEAATPCAHFNVRQVLEHMVGGATLFAAAFRGTSPPAGSQPSDVVTALPKALADLQDAMRSPGALERTVAAPFGEVPGEMFARFVALDGLVHGWDIATATHQPYDPPADVVAAVEAFAHQAIAEGMRDGDTFAAATEPPADASPLTRLAAFTGRTVA